MPIPMLPPASKESNRLAELYIAARREMRLEKRERAEKRMRSALRASQSATEALRASQDNFRGSIEKVMATIHAVWGNPPQFHSKPWSRRCFLCDAQGWCVHREPELCEFPLADKMVEVFGGDDAA